MQSKKIMWTVRLTLAIACFCILLFVVKAFPSGLGLDLGLDLGTGSNAGPSGDALLLETGSYLLLETGDYLLLG